jgi:hypothetical protein
MRMRSAVALIAVAGAAFVYTQMKLFIVQPIGAVPDGVTLLMWRTGRLHFIESADALCAREMGGVSLLCRGGVLAGVAQANAIIARLPYSESLYLVSTGGVTYGR